MELGQHRTGAQGLEPLLWLPAGTHDPRNAAQAAHAGGAMGAPRPVDRGIRSQNGYGCGGALGSNSGITRPSTSVKPYSFASSAAHNNCPVLRNALGSAASAAAARPMYSTDSLRSKRNCFLSASRGHVPEHPLGAHEARIQSHHRHLRFLQLTAHVRYQAVQELVAEIPENLSAIRRHIGVDIVGDVNEEAAPLLHHDACGMHTGEPGGVDGGGSVPPDAGAQLPERLSAMVAPQAESTMRSSRPCSSSTRRNKVAASSSLPRSARTGMPWPPRAQTSSAVSSTVPCD